MPDYVVTLIGDYSAVDDEDAIAQFGDSFGSSSEIPEVRWPVDGDGEACVVLQRNYSAPNPEVAAGFFREECGIEQGSLTVQDEDNHFFEVDEEGTTTPFAPVSQWVTEFAV